MVDHDLAAKEKQQPPLEHDNEKRAEERAEENAGTSASGDSEYRLPEKSPVCIGPLYDIGNAKVHPCISRYIHEVQFNLLGL